MCKLGLKKSSGALVFLFLIIPIIPVVSHATSLPNPQGYVSDFAGVVSPEDKSAIEGWAGELKEKTGAEVAVVTIDSLDGDAVEDYAVNLFRSWGIGEKGKDNGLLILVAPNDREMRIEVGYGLEGIIPDALAGRIARERMFPHFKEGDYSKGILNGTSSLITLIAQKLNIEIGEGGGRRPVLVDEQGRPGRLFSLVYKLLLGVVMIYLFIRHPFLFLFLLSGMGGGGSGRGFSRGGFGGFGGGLSGGGGFSGKW